MVKIRVRVLWVVMVVRVVTVVGVDGVVRVVGVVRVDGVVRVRVILSEILKWQRFLKVICCFLKVICRFLKVICRFLKVICQILKAICRFLKVILTRDRYRAARAAKGRGPEKKPVFFMVSCQTGGGLARVVKKTYCFLEKVFFSESM